MMPAWVYVVALAIVLFVAWYGFARRWWHALRYSWRNASHAYAEVEDDYGSSRAFYGSAPLQGSMTLTEEIAYWNGNWRERTRVELAPETLDLLAAPLDSDIQPDPYIDTIAAEHGSEFDDPGPGGAGLSSSPPPGPDHDDGWPPETPQSGMVMVWRDGHAHYEWPPGTRLADTGEVEAAREAHPSPDWLACQLAVTFDWVRAMVPQVTGWSVGL